MRKHYSLAHADRVLSLLRKELKGVKSANDDHVSIEAWANCREQGYCIKVYSKEWDNNIAICFAQYRSSDSTVVVSGPAREFNNQTNQPSERVWEKNNRHFKVDEDKKAAEYIAGEILKVVEPVAVKMMETTP